MTGATVKKRKIKLAAEDRAYYTIVNVFLVVLLLLIGYPLLYILSASFSSPAAVTSGQVFLWPVEPSLEGYQAIFVNDSILIGYRNSLIYAVIGTTINVFMTMIAAYPLSRKDFPGGRLMMFLFSFTMIFSGGMIPTYIVMSQMKLLNTMWVMVLPGAISVYNMIITRTFIQNNIPAELLEAAKMDGCSDIRFLISIVVPLSKAVMAVITLYYAIGHWNAYFNAFLYLTDKRLYPLQIILRDILISNQIDPNMVYDEDLAAAKQGLADLLKYSLIVVATVPVLAIYPFIQRHFVKGVMIGSIKG